jgi:hypothetical protein
MLAPNLLILEVFSPKNLLQSIQKQLALENIPFTKLPSFFKNQNHLA